ncbi:hypothetical protein P8452_05896 [Trifolium repens]|nr:hypothetical protein P8452_05896 [Trifolium repens]
MVDWKNKSRSGRIDYYGYCCDDVYLDSLHILGRKKRPRFRIFKLILVKSFASSINHYSHTAFVTIGKVAKYDRCV